MVLLWNRMINWKTLLIKQLICMLGMKKIRMKKMHIIVNLPTKKQEFWRINTTVVLNCLICKLMKWKKCMVNNTIYSTTTLNTKVRSLMKASNHSLVRFKLLTKSLNQV
jgi:hypothetical protein